MGGKTKVKVTAIFIASLFVLAAPALVQQAGARVAQTAKRTLVWVDREGNVQPLDAPARAYYLPRLSPDGQRIAVEIVNGKRDIWVFDIPSGSLSRVTSEAINRFPLWTPDGKRIAFSSNRAAPILATGRPPFFDDHNVFWKLADGSGEAQQLTVGEHGHGAQAWSADGQLLVFYEIHPTTGRDIWILPMQGERKPWLYLQTPFLEGGVAFSPDGRWMAYTSDESGRNEIYVQPFPGPGERLQVSTDGGTGVIWPRIGRELFYRKDDQRIAVEITTEPTLTVAQPRVLFEGNYVRSPGSRANYDVTSDGQRFLMLKAAE